MLGSGGRCVQLGFPASSKYAIHDVRYAADLAVRDRRAGFVEDGPIKSIEQCAHPREIVQLIPEEPPDRPPQVPFGLARLAVRSFDLGEGPRPAKPRKVAYEPRIKVDFD
jgi:hypothetical protein